MRLPTKWVAHQRINGYLNVSWQLDIHRRLSTLFVEDENEKQEK